MTERRTVMRPAVRLSRIVSILLFALLAGNVAASWYDPAWLYRQRITILPALTDSTLSGFPCLVKITDAANPVFAHAQPNGNDLLFTDSTGAFKLNHEMEKYDNSTKELFAWVNVPEISATVDTVIYLYYGNGAASNQENVPDTWDDDFVIVQHLEETSGTHFDSAGSNDGSPLGGLNQDATGRIDGADQFDGTDDYIEIADSPNLRVVEMTLEAWVYLPGSIPGGFRGIVEHAAGTTNWYGLWKADSSDTFHFRWSTGAVRRTDFDGAIVADTWYYVVGVLDPGATEARTFLNGIPDKTVPNPSLPTPTSGSTRIGLGGPADPEWFDGTIDEVRISKTARTADWIEATFRNLDDTATYQTLDPEQEAYTIAGTVFEDVNYGGGIGRNLATANADAPSFSVERGNATVELYDAAGGFLSSTTTAVADGSYSFAGLVPSDYIVRVVNDTVTSGRPGADGSQLGVQTYRIDGDGEVVGTGARKVGGELPSNEGAVANSGAQTLASLQGTDLDADGVMEWTQSIVTVDANGGSVIGVDFGYNFDTIVNTNDAGQGSLRQFLLNSNGLTNANLAQAGLTAGTEHSLFMIPSDADPFGRAQDPGFDPARGVAVITPSTLLPAIVDADTAVDGTTQTVGVEDSNTATLGAGGSVGVDGLALPTLAGPEIEIVDTAGLLTGIDVQADDATIRGLAIYGFGPALNTGNVRVGLDDTTNFTGVTVEDNVLGTFADSFTDPDLALAGSGTDGASFAALGADFGTLRRNLLGFSGRNAAIITKAANDWTVEQNEFRSAGLDDARSDGLGLTDDVERTSVTGNLFADNQGAGVDFFSSVGSHTLVNNTFDGNGQGGVETAGIRMFGADGLLDRNVFNNQVGSGVLAVVSDPAFPTANTPATRQRITRNHFGGNGANAIDLQTTLDIIAPGDGITPNDGTLLGDSSVPNACGIVATHGNEGLDTPVIDQALQTGPNTGITGRACPNSEVEIYRAVADVDSSDSLAGADYGEGLVYLGTATSDGSGDFGTSVTGVVAGDEVSAIAIDGSDNTSEFGENVTVIAARTISGTVFEDVNYGGGIGRDLATAAADAPTFAVGRGNVTVELYQAGALLSTAATAVVDGSYSFTGLVPGSYTVRVVNGTVTSSRPGSDGSELGVQTYRIDGAAEGAGDGARKVGGELPSHEDAAANSGAQTLASLQGTDLDTDGVTEWTQSIVTVDASGGDVAGVDFGFNFDVIVNTNDAGQGTLRQFILNSNLLN